MKYAYNYETAIGRLGIAAAEEGVSNIWFGGVPVDSSTEILETPLISNAAGQIQEYLEGCRRVFDLPLYYPGTPFQVRVWDALREIPYGAVRSYKDIALVLGSEKAVRAVGMANHVNPLAIIIPCHRVIGRNGSLVGYAGGLDIKRKLLALEARDELFPEGFFRTPAL
ncbi:methylated-DNA--[protein]-cysteine S-methyltransferase [Breznakiella homolactica]|uniref:Methylated-DNA--protein-cysteine methyltransferase n=1 Tax=Breznakiella homolactica TaxID=2798577 RepID=A0A7T7XRJ7_9SPIR|nr:methylated-DNA--[protein]-cysteine S-methyltransferase [Breznakiella homolactica]QQO11098.1 methylated-DNA--[protein]-cysteine S-methyltransferase [Breznakiella homolactica]